MYVRKEEVLSSMIEGTQSSLSDLLLFELDMGPGVPMDDVREVSNYAAALDHGSKRLSEGSPLTVTVAQAVEIARQLADPTNKDRDEISSIDRAAPSANWKKHEAKFSIRIRV